MAIDRPQLGDLRSRLDFKVEPVLLGSHGILQFCLVHFFKLRLFLDTSYVWLNVVPFLVELLHFRVLVH